MQFAVTLTALVEADSISDVDDDRMCEAVMEQPGVVAVQGSSPHEAARAPTDQQMLKVGSQWRQRVGSRTVGLVLEPFDLPDGYIVAHFDGGQTQRGGFTLGISLEGEGSS